MQMRLKAGVPRAVGGANAKDQDSRLSRTYRQMY